MQESSTLFDKFCDASAMPKSRSALFFLGACLFAERGDCEAMLARALHADACDTIGARASTLLHERVGGPDPAPALVASFVEALRARVAYGGGGTTASSGGGAAPAWCMHFVRRFCDEVVQILDDQMQLMLESSGAAERADLEKRMRARIDLVKDSLCAQRPGVAARVALLARFCTRLAQSRTGDAHARRRAIVNAWVQFAAGDPVVSRWCKRPNDSISNCWHDHVSEAAAAAAAAAGVDEVTAAVLQAHR